MTRHLITTVSSGTKVSVDHSDFYSCPAQQTNGRRRIMEVSASLNTQSGPATLVAAPVQKKLWRCQVCPDSPLASNPTGPSKSSLLLADACFFLWRCLALPTCPGVPSCAGSASATFHRLSALLPHGPVMVQRHCKSTVSFGFCTVSRTVHCLVDHSLWRAGDDDATDDGTATVNPLLPNARDVQVYPVLNRGAQLSCIGG